MNVPHSSICTLDCASSLILPSLAYNSLLIIYHHQHHLQFPFWLSVSPREQELCLFHLCSQPLAEYMLTSW
jgi:hypothetical protein